MKLVDDDAAERADFVACLKKVNDTGAFSDNEEGVCSKCGEVVIFRPYAPKKPARICMECVTEMLGGKQELAKQACTTNRSFAEAVNHITGGDHDDTGGTRH
jgi:hypothetical protein